MNVNGEVVIVPKIYAVIEAERDRQREKGYTAAHDDAHDPADFATYIDARVRIIDHIRIHGGDLSGYRERYTEIAALAVAALEKIERMPGGRP